MITSLRPAVASLVLALASCGSPARTASPPPSLEKPDVTMPTPPTDAGAGAHKAARGKEVWEALNAAVARYHVFTPRADQNLGVRFQDAIAPLEAKFAITEGDAIGPLVEQFVNALHNPHCFFDAAKRADRLSLGVTLDVAWDHDRPVYYVARVDDLELRTTVSEGDVLREADGVASADLVSTRCAQTRTSRAVSPTTPHRSWSNETR